MHELLYYSIFAIILYFVLTQVFENFNIEQENFDPSLVPVSSIVTLAKVAQKLVNGNGTLTNPGNLQIGASASAPGNLTVTGNFLLGNKAMLYANGDKFANDNWVRLMKADGATAYSGMNGGGLAVSNLYSEQDTTVNRNLQVNGSASITGNLNVTGDSVSNLGKPSRINLKDIFGGHPGITTEATDRPLWILSSNKEVNIGHPDASLKNRLYVSGNTVLAGNLDIAGNVNGNVNLPGGDISVKGTVELKDRQGGGSKQVLYNDGDTLGLYSSTKSKRTFGIDNVGNLSSGGNINARTDGFNTRIGGIWTAPGIYAEGTANLEIGSGSSNVFIGSAEGVPNNLIVQGLSYFGGNGENGFRWGNEGGNGWSCLRTNKSDNRMCFHQNHGVTHFSPNGVLNLPAGGKICISGTCINEEQLQVLNGTRGMGIRSSSRTGYLTNDGKAFFQYMGNDEINRNDRNVYSGNGWGANYWQTFQLVTLPYMV